MGGGGVMILCVIVGAPLGLILCCDGKKIKIFLNRLDSSL